ncbi:hypothetical protein [Shimia biformata]|uniref:hypothetical protein n=1 Tax=Shimia biformata TaxID=1294299 RepID=UPI00194EFB5C|nr:hypothetical protein [Shimia biformata]
MGPGRYSGLGIALFAVPFYAGPVLAGAARAPLAVIPVFAVLFLGYLVAVGRVTLSRTALPIFLLTAVIQVILASFAYASGVALAIPLPPVTVPLWCPLLLTTAAAVWGAWRYRDAIEVNAMLNDITSTLDAADMEFGLPDNDPLVARLDALTDDQVPEMVNAVLRHGRIQAAVETALMRTHDNRATTRLALALMADPRFPSGLMNYLVIDNILEEIRTNQDRQLARLAVPMVENLDYPDPGPFRDELYRIAGHRSP